MTATPLKHALCPECQSASAAWLSYKVHPGMRISCSATYDDTAAGLADRRRGVFESWRGTIRHQRQLIRDICATQHRPLVLSPFAGPGGWCTGLRMAGYTGYN